MSTTKPINCPFCQKSCLYLNDEWICFEKDHEYYVSDNMFGLHLKVNNTLFRLVYWDEKYSFQYDDVKINVPPVEKELLLPTLHKYISLKSFL